MKMRTLLGGEYSKEANTLRMQLFLGGKRSSKANAPRRKPKCKKPVGVARLLLDSIGAFGEGEQSEPPRPRLLPMAMVAQ